MNNPTSPVRNPFAALKWCGFLGHRYVVLSPSDRPEHASHGYTGRIETNDWRASLTGILPIRAGDRVFEQTKRGQWKEIKLTAKEQAIVAKNK